MEREQELRKIINVLRKTARMAMQSHWTGAGGQSARFCVEQYNRILSRLKEIDPDVATIFAPLPEDAPLETVAIACRQLAAYYEEEAYGKRGDWGSFYETAYECGPFKILFGRSFRDLEDIGRIIRESFPEWMRGEGWSRERKGPQGEKQGPAGEEKK